ncbi:hypothetical protein SRB17_01050 [Streptomyces sp. RB17]|nr:hypothetical protein [Streptomyces sp. RB17]
MHGGRTESWARQILEWVTSQADNDTNSANGHPGSGATLPIDSHTSTSCDPANPTGGVKITDTGTKIVITGGQGTARRSCSRSAPR